MIVYRLIQVYALVSKDFTLAIGLVFILLILLRALVLYDLMLEIGDDGEGDAEIDDDGDAEIDDDGEIELEGLNELDGDNEGDAEIELEGLNELDGDGDADGDADADGDEDGDELILADGEEPPPPVNTQPKVPLLVNVWIV
jgi:hypothetical protein